MLKICILGYGGIARAHKAGYTALKKKGKAKLVAVCDTDPARFEQAVKTNLDSGEAKAEPLPFNTYTDLDEMLEKEQPDIVTVCLPTFLHKEKTVYLLQKGYNVMCEKPMSLKYEDCLEMINAAKSAGKILMIGQCVRFFSEYEYLKNIIDSGEYGKVRSAYFHRLSVPPVWGWQNWFMDSDLSGGCIHDLHIHDIDFIRYAFGEPRKVSCISREGYTKWESAVTSLWYDGFAVTAIGDWSLKNHPFEPAYRVAFEKATVEMSGGKVTVYPVDGEKLEPEIPAKNGYGAEVEYMCDVLNGETENTKNRPESAAISVKLAETLKISAARDGEPVAFEV